MKVKNTIADFSLAKISIDSNSDICNKKMFYLSPTKIDDQQNMLNKIISQMNSDVDFMKFIHSNFMHEISGKSFPENYKKRKMPEEKLELMENKSESKNIQERQLIRDNIYIKHKFDIFEKPIVVFYESEKTKILKPFLRYKEADSYSQALLTKGIYSMLIFIMNRHIECKIYKN